MTTSTFDPFREIDRVLTSAFRQGSTNGMPMDLYKSGERFVARVDLPGVDPESIDIDVDDRILTIRADRDDKVADDVQWLTHERANGTFARQISLGYGLALDQIEAEYVDGVLTLTIPVAEEAKPRKIQVTHSQGSRVVQGEATDSSDGADSKDGSN